MKTVLVMLWGNFAMYRIGQGFDIHKLVEDRKLILGGVEIPFEKGLLGHSDADCLIHAIIDSIFGALALGDIGSHFPDTDMKYKDADSAELLKETVKIMEEKDYKLVNLDSTIKIQSPKMRPYIDKIRENLAEIFMVDADKISVKAKTMEGLGIVGKGDAVICDAIIMLKKN